jgi:hypothetical protein
MEPQGIGLDFLIAVRCPEMAVGGAGAAWSQEDIRRILSGYATTLVKCADEFLAGDFTIFPEVHKYQLKERMRREQLLYGPPAEHADEQ